jgi:hypothetical protein
MGQVAARPERPPRYLGAPSEAFSVSGPCGVEGDRSRRKCDGRFAIGEPSIRRRVGGRDPRRMALRHACLYHGDGAFAKCRIERLETRARDVSIGTLDRPSAVAPPRDRRVGSARPPRSRSPTTPVTPRTGVVLVPDLVRVSAFAQVAPRPHRPRPPPRSHLPQWKAAKRQQGDPRFHDLRHSYATLLITKARVAIDRPVNVGQRRQRLRAASFKGR